MEGELLATLRHALEAKEAYVAELPAWVRAWMTWMRVVLPTCLLFGPWKSEARWVLLGLFASQLVANAIGIAFGWSRLWGLAHLLCWSPVVVLLLRRWPALDFRPRLAGRTLRLTPLYRGWAALTLGTMGSSLAFDALDVARYAIGAG